MAALTHSAPPLSCGHLQGSAGSVARPGYGRIWGLSQGQKHGGVWGGTGEKRVGELTGREGGGGRVEGRAWQLGGQLQGLAGMAWGSTGKEAVLGGEKTEVEAFVEVGQRTERDGVVT